jgi:hypothetical protein
MFFWLWAKCGQCISTLTRVTRVFLGFVYEAALWPNSSSRKVREPLI